jgi:hypothetical protein
MANALHVFPQGEFIIRGHLVLDDPLQKAHCMSVQASPFIPSWLAFVKSLFSQPICQ